MEPNRRASAEQIVVEFEALDGLARETAVMVTHELRDPKISMVTLHKAIANFYTLPADAMLLACEFIERLKRLADENARSSV